MTSLGGFWSYAHADDDADSGRIAELARDIVAQYEMLTGESIELFLDLDAVAWGNAWQEKVDQSLETVAFFIPVLTPRYFQRPECRRELHTFAVQADRLGLSKLIMPLRYVDFPALSEDEPSDKLIALVKKYHWIEWTELRFSERGSGEYRREVAGLAAQLVAANLEVSQASIAPSSTTQPVPPDEDDEPGLMDRMADAEEALPIWTETVDEIGHVLEELGGFMQAATEQMDIADKRGKGFAGRVLVARKLTADLDGPADKMVDLGNRFAQELAAVDSGIRAIIDLASGAVGTDPEERVQIEEFFTSIRDLSGSAVEGFDQVRSMIDQMAPVEKMSRDLREPLRRMRQGLTAMVEGRQITTEWVRLIDELGLVDSLVEPE